MGKAIPSRHPAVVLRSHFMDTLGRRTGRTGLEMASRRPRGGWRLWMAAMSIAVGVSMFGSAAGAAAVPPVQIAGSDQGNTLVADCGTFQVWDEFTLNWRGTEHYDQDGNPVRVVEHVWGVDRLYNADSGKSFGGSFNQGEMVDLVEGQVKVGGIIFRITVPGSGAVLLDVGRFIFDFDEGIVFLAGQHQVIEGDLEGLCAALS
jgi:hypothetical protein